MNIKFTAFDKATGRILFAGTADDPNLLISESDDVFIGAIYNDGWLENEVHHSQPAPPSINHVFNWNTKQWEDPRTLADLKKAANNRINTARLSANQSGFTHLGKLFATDPLSRSDIDGINGYVTLYGALPTNWAGAWKAEDNTYLPIEDLDAWKAFYGSMVAAGNSNFAISEQLKLNLQDATTAEEVEAIVWPT